MTETVYEDLLAGGNPDTPANPGRPRRLRPGRLPALVSFGADQPGTITLSPTTSGLPQNLTSIGAPVVYNVTGNLLTAFVDSGGTPGVLERADRQVFTLQITNPATGAYTFTLLDQLDHGLGTNDNDEALIAIDFSSVLVATDADGDFIPLTRRLHHQCRERHSGPDLPRPWRRRSMRTCWRVAIPIRRRIRRAPRRLRPGRLPAWCRLVRTSPGPITLSPTTSGLPQNLTSIGAPVVYNVTGNLLTAYVDSGATPGVLERADRQVFTLQITDPATGAYTFTLLDQLDHGLGTNDNDEALIAIDLSSVLVATDADGDFIPLTRRLHHQCRERHSGRDCRDRWRRRCMRTCWRVAIPIRRRTRRRLDDCDRDACRPGVVWRGPARDDHAVADHVGSAAEPDVDWCACCLQRHRQPADGVC